MDSVTHTLLGAGVSHAFFRRRMPESLPVLLAASNLPDIDALVHLTSDPAAITLRRSFGHSVFLFPLWAAALAWVFGRKYPERGFLPLYGLCMLGCCLHVFFDLVNSFGVLALWPFSGYRPELAILFIIDPYLAVTMALPFLVFLVPSWRARARHAFRAGIAAAAAYVLFCAAGRLQAEMILRQAEPRAEFSYVFPEPFGPQRWRGVAKSGDEYRLYLLSAWKGTAEPRGSVATAEADPRAAQAAATPLGRRLLGFFKAPVFRVEGDRVRLYDLRFRSLLLDRGGLFEFDLPLRPQPSTAAYSPGGPADMVFLVPWPRRTPSRAC